VLAAGSSSRLGKPKQLLLYKEKSLLQHAVQVAADSIAGPVVVVTGAIAERIEKELMGFKIILAENNKWEEGMASSVCCGLNTLLHEAPLTDSAILMVCDQPYINTQLLNDLLATQQKTGQPIVTSQYENVFGTPALFHKSIFPELLALKGDAGARRIVEQHTHEMATVPFPGGIIDIDTEADYDELEKA
jgi:molybdenum cofactor cytidylyltransferase